MWLLISDTRSLSVSSSRFSRPNRKHGGNRGGSDRVPGQKLDFDAMLCRCIAGAEPCTILKLSSSMYPKRGNGELVILGDSCSNTSGRDKGSVTCGTVATRQLVVKIIGRKLVIADV
jgi:hypothetical protein